MSVFHHVVKSLGTRYDPMGANVVAHVVGGGSVGNTVFHDVSPMRTPVLTVGNAAGVASAGPFGNAVGIRGATLPAGVLLNANDKRYTWDYYPAQTYGDLGQFTIDGWVKTNPGTSPNRRRVICAFHGTGYTGNLWAGVSSGGDANGITFMLVCYEYSAGAVFEVRLVGHNGSSYVEQTYTMWGAGTLPPEQLGAWLYYHLVHEKNGNFTLRVGNNAPQSVVVTSRYNPGANAKNTSITLGSLPNGAQLAGTLPLEWFTFRLTRGHRPFSAALLASPWPEAGGTQNWQGDPAGAAGQPGQRELTPAQTWTVPAGVTHISAAAIGCKLTIEGTDVLAATWPVLGDGGGQGGGGGTGHQVEVTSESGAAAFGGSPPTYTTEIYRYHGGGGGAGGYTGPGGNGMRTQGGTPNSAGQGGGGGGGATGAPGGGVGLRGLGASGVGNHNPGKPGSATGTTYGGGLPGAGATLNGTAGNHLAWRNNIPVTQGQVVLCTYIGQPGQTGAARIMWGDARSYPNDAGDV